MRAFLFLLCLFLTSDLHAGEGIYVHARGGYARGIDHNRDIRKHEARLGLEQVFHPALSGGPEFALLRFSGTRDGISADTGGGTLVYQLKWHALRYHGTSMNVGFGYGGAFFKRPFPPGGTRFNGYSFIGVGAVVPLSERWVAILDVRQMHHSNGRGLVADNPAFDGLSFHLSVGYRP